MNNLQKKSYGLRLMVGHRDVITHTGYRIRQYALLKPTYISNDGSISGLVSWEFEVPEINFSDLPDDEKQQIKDYFNDKSTKTD